MSEDGRRIAKGRGRGRGRPQTAVATEQLDVNSSSGPSSTAVGADIPSGVGADAGKTEKCASGLTLTV